MRPATEYYKKHSYLISISLGQKTNMHYKSQNKGPDLIIGQRTSAGSARVSYTLGQFKGTDTANTITINNFDLGKAQSSQAGSSGYLGIKIAPTKVLVAALGSALAAQGNPYAQKDFSDANLSGSSSFGQGAGITLAEGQTQVSFALVSDAEITADQTGTLSLCLQNAQGVDSAPGTPTNTYYGDYAGNHLMTQRGERAPKRCTAQTLRQRRYYKNNSYSCRISLGHRAKRHAKKPTFHLGAGHD